MWLLISIHDVLEIMGVLTGKIQDTIIIVLGYTMLGAIIIGFGSKIAKYSPEMVVDYNNQVKELEIKEIKQTGCRYFMRKVWLWVKSLFSLLLRPKIIFSIFLITTTLCGIFFSSFFFALNILEMIPRSSDLILAMRSVWLPKTQIAMAFLLFGIMSYYFSIIGYISFAPQFVLSQVDSTIDWV